MLSLTYKLILYFLLAQRHSVPDLPAVWIHLPRSNPSQRRLYRDRQPTFHPPAYF